MTKETKANKGTTAQILRDEKKESSQNGRVLTVGIKELIPTGSQQLYIKRAYTRTSKTQKEMLVLVLTDGKFINEEGKITTDNRTETGLTYPEAHQPIFLNLLLDGTSFKLDQLIRETGPIEIKNGRAKDIEGTPILCEVIHTEFEGRSQAEVYKIFKS